jgi:N-acetylmuramoyl-L-alanine amidase
MNGYKTGTYIINCSKLNVRTGPGTNYRKKTIKELTKSARKQGGYVRGVRCTVSEIRGHWGKTPSGWICLDYCNKISKKY